ncbi:MAG: PqqD family protein [Clostridia bacterium]|nr:PqqD family protein [Clostridia bacterium]
MKIKQGFNLKKENGQTVVACDKNINRDFNSAIVLTETSAFLWNMIQNENTSKEKMLNALLDNFDISTVLALNNIDVFIKTLKENGILEE